MAEVAEKTKKSIGFGKEEKALISDPLNDNNPITVQVLGICSALAVTTGVKNSFVMALAVIFVVIGSNMITSMLRNAIPKQVRMIVQLVIIASLVTIVELTLKAVSFESYKALSVFIGLIITNCIVMGRLEAFAMANDPYRSMFDGLGNGLGYGIILIIIGSIREILGKGEWWGIKLIGYTDEYLINTTSSPLLSWYSHNNLMVLFPSAMFVIAVLIWIHRAWNRKLIDIS